MSKNMKRNKTPESIKKEIADILVCEGASCEIAEQMEMLQDLVFDEKTQINPQDKLQIIKEIADIKTCVERIENSRIRINDIFNKSGIRTDGW